MGNKPDFAIFKPASSEEVFEKRYKNPKGYKRAVETHFLNPWQNDDGAIRIALNSSLSMLSDYIERLYNQEVNYNGMEYGCFVDLPKRIKWFSDRYQLKGSCLKNLQNIIKKLKTNGAVDEKFLTQSKKVIEQVRNLCRQIQKKIKCKSVGIFIDLDDLPQNWRI